MIVKHDCKIIMSMTIVTLISIRRKIIETMIIMIITMMIMILIIMFLIIIMLEIWLW